MASITPEQKKTLQEKLSLLDKISEKINNKFGMAVMGRIGQTPEIMERLKIKFIPTPSKELNTAVGGGFPRRRCSIVVGKEDSGKTSLLLETIAKNMKSDPTFVAGWLESENSLEKDYICDTFGIDRDRFYLLPLNKNLGAEKTLDVVQQVLAQGALDIFVINSLKCLVPDKEMEASLSDSLVANQARMNSRMTKKFTALVAQHDTAFVIISHLSTDIGSMSRDPLIISGGHAIKYWSSLTLDLRKRSIAPTGEIIAPTEGVKIGVTVKKNHCIPSVNPYVKLEYYAVFGEGIEQILSSINEAIAEGVLESHGNWLYWQKDGETVEKFSGKAAFRKYMKENPDKFEEYQNQLNGKANVEELSEDEIKKIMDDDIAVNNAALVEEDSESTKKSRKKKAEA